MQSQRTISVILNGITRRKVQRLLGITCFSLFAPLIVIILASLYVYRRLVELLLKIQFRDKFAGFLKGTDCVWAIEDTVSLSVINILLILEKTDTRSSNANFLQNFKKLVNDRIVARAAGTTLEKMFHHRGEKFGYYFWKKSDEVDLDRRIRWFECEDVDCDGSCEDVTSETFRRNLGNVCNRPLPDDHAAAWEILVGERCARFDDHNFRHVRKGRTSFQNRVDTSKIPVIFRVHHSLGDGVALLDLLLKAIAEEDEGKMMKPTKLKDDTRSISVDESFKEIASKNNCQEDILAACMPFTCVTLSEIFNDLRNHLDAISKCSDSVALDSIKRQVKVSIGRAWLNFKDLVLKQWYEKIDKAVQVITIVLSVPEYFVQRAICNIDENALHGPSQTGRKIVSYWLENDIATDDKSQKLLTQIREIRNSTGTRFADVILAAFSVGVHKYHLRIDKPVPEALTAVLPIRMAMPDENITLDNTFSVAELRVCICNANGQAMSEPNENSCFFERLQDIARASNELKRDPGLLINFWFMKYLSAVLPVKLTRALLSSQSTAVFSNVRGPQKVRILDSSLSNVAFWIPNKSTTALGFSLLTYGDNVHLCLLADESIVENEKFFMEILQDTVHEIHTAYNSIINSTLRHQ